MVCISLEPSTITAVDRRAGVHVDPSDIGERLVGGPYLADWVNELVNSLAGLIAEERSLTEAP